MGAALLTTTGEIIKGANVENASYGKDRLLTLLEAGDKTDAVLGGTICAERTALVKAVVRALLPCVRWEI